MKHLFLFTLAAFPLSARAQTAPPAPKATPLPLPETTVVASIPADAPVVAPPLKSRDLTVELVGGDIALVRDARRLTLAMGANRLRLVGVPATRTTLGLNVSPRVRILRDLGSRPPASVAVENFDLARFVGQKITILRSGVGNEERAATGTLLSLDPVLLDTGSGVLLDPKGQWVLPSGSIKTTPRDGARAPDDSKGEPEWILGASQSGAFLAEYRYQLKGMTFAPQYTATLEGERVRLEGVVNVQNNLDAATTRDLRGASLVVAGGKLRFAAPVELSTGLNSLGFVSGEAPLRARFSFRRSTPFEQSFVNQLAQRSVFIENGSDNGLGVFLPPGKLVLNRTTVQNGVPTTSLLSQTEGWGGFAPGGQVDLPLGPSDTVKVSRTVTSRLLNPVTREWTVEFSVRSDEPLALLETLPKDARLGEVSPKPSASSDGTLSWTLAPSNDSISIKYSIEVPEK